MKKREPLGPVIDRLIKEGKSTREIVRLTGCDSNYASIIRSYGGWEARNAAQRDAARAGAKARGNGYIQAERNAAARQRAAPIIAAVDAGLTYRQAAKKFGLVSRNAVAGIMNRRPEAQS